MSAQTELRRCLKDMVEHKAGARKAGEGYWTWSVRAMCANEQPATANAVDARHTELKGELEDISPLSKEERNSLAASKSVVRAAIENGKDLWRRTDDGSVMLSGDGNRIPRGKSDLQNDRTAFDTLMRQLEMAEKLVQGDKWDSPNDDQRTAIVTKIQSILASCGIVV